MLKSSKKNLVSKLEEIYNSSSAIIVTHYHSLTVADITKLRKVLQQNGAYFKIVKNTLLKIAAQNLNLINDFKIFSGPTAIAYSKNPVLTAKEIVGFAKIHSNLKIIGGIVNNKILGVDEVRYLASLPPLDQLRGKIIGILQAPAANLVRITQAPGSSLARVVQARVSNLEQ